ncbi:MAG: protein kinase [Acidobacteriota bacterium]
MSTLSPDSTISHYKIKELIGRGGMGEIYKAVDLELGRVVAIKTLSPELTADQNAHQRFLREARAASILSHPSICTVFEVGKEGDLVFIAMQYLQGRTIHELLTQGPMPIESAVSYALDVAEALEEAHKNGVIHRDIKPSNIIVNERGSAVVLDFGLAKQVSSYLSKLTDESPTMMHVTTAAAIIGTAPYMSPEQVRGEAVDARSDVFSFGATFYEMLSGVRPFTGRSSIEAMHAILHEEPKPLSKVRREVGRDLERIVTKAMKKEPADRYDSVNELKLELVEYIQSKGIQIRGASTRPSAVSSPMTIKTRILPTGSFVSTTSRILSPRVRLPVAVIVPIAVAVAGVIWWLIARTPNETQTEFLSSLKFVQLANWKNEADEDVESVLSRDGKLIAFSTMGGGVPNLWIKQSIGGDPNPIQITKGEWNNNNPIFSPDGSQIAFKSNRGKQFGIWRMPAFGGTPTLLKQVDTEYKLISWSDDGHTIYYLYTYGSAFDTDLLALNTTSGDTKLVAHFDQRIVYLSVSPGEDRIVYVANKDGQEDLWVMPVSGGAPARITNDPARDMNLAWLPDGKRIVYSSDRDGTFQICIAYLDGRKPLQITFGETSVFVQDVSADGTKILYKNLKEESDIWGVRLDTGSELELASDVNVKLWPDVSPDGKTIAYQSIRELGHVKLDKCRILTRPIATEGPQNQLAAEGIKPLWSPDGEHVAFVRRSKGWNLWTVRAAGGDERQLTTDGVNTGGQVSAPYNRVLPKDYSWTFDSKRIVYCTSYEQSSVCMVAVDGSGETHTLVPTNLDLIFYCPFLSPDATRIAYLSRTRVAPADGNQLWSIWVLDTKTERSEIIFQKNSFLRLLGWSGDNLVAGTADLDVPSEEPRGITLFQVSATGGVKHEIAHPKSAYLYNSFLSPDGRVIAVPVREDAKDNVWLISVNGGKGRRVTSNTDPKLYFSSMAWSPDGKAIFYGKQLTRTLISMIENFR